MEGERDRGKDGGREREGWKEKNETTGKTRQERRKESRGRFFISTSKSMKSFGKLLQQEAPPFGASQFDTLIKATLWFMALSKLN